MDQHIRRYENWMCAIMKKTKKVMKRNIELEQELKSRRDGYEGEIDVLLEKHEDLKKKLGIPMVNQKQEPEVDIRSKNYIILDDTDTDNDAYDDSDDDYVDKAGADMSLPPIKISRRPPCYYLLVVFVQVVSFG